MQTMKKVINTLFLSAEPLPQKTVNIAWLLFRLHLGLSMAIGAGLPKIINIAPPDWFVTQVSDLGFTFPSPVFWAAMAAWGEFLGGILIALGLFTRFAAIQLAFQFFIISFIWYKNPEPVVGMCIQQLFFWCYVWIAVKGGGVLSLDKLLQKRRKIDTKPIVILSCCLLLMGTTSFGQERKPIRGSGNIATLKPAAKDFDKIDISGMNGQVFVEAGKSFSVTIEADDNLVSLIKTKVEAGKLYIELQGNEYNKLYIENTSIKVNIQMPEISVMEYEGNGKTEIKLLTGRYFRLRRQGNADCTIEGRVDEAEIFTDGNGNVNAAALEVKNLKVRKTGNGNVTVNTNQSFKVTGAGNGDVINLGQGRADALSVLVGNGKMRYPNQASEIKKQAGETAAARKMVQVVLKNNTQSTAQFTVVYPVKGTYGIEVKAGDSLPETFPVGTKLYRGNPYTRMLKKPVFVITADSGKEPLIIK
jgi:uncharacterized membrane protein YphA (DoxX/SURF4 family)